MIELDCPTCGKMLRIPAEFRGQMGKCNGCSGPIYVPRASLRKGQKVPIEKAIRPVVIEPVAADWRSDPASNQQLGLLADLGATPRQMIGLTKEQASALIEKLQDTGASQSMAFNSGGAPLQLVQHINVHNAPYPQHVVYAIPPKSRIVYILLAIFFGGLGIHNFYAGRSGAGVAQLIITLFTGWMLLPLFIIFVWVLLEICIVTEDGSGQRFN